MGWLSSCGPIRAASISKEGETALDVTAYAAHMAALLGAHIIKVKPPTAYIEQPEAKKVYEKEKIDGSTLAKRIAHVVQASFAGKRIVVFSGGPAKDLNGIYDEARAIRDGGGQRLDHRPQHLPAAARGSDEDAGPDHRDLPGQGLMAEADGARAARCRLYLEGPDPLPANFAALLDIALSTGDIACLRLSPHPDIGPLITKVQTKGCAVLLNDSVGDVALLGADGVHLWQPEAYQQAREMLGPTASIGVFCGNSRHTAMEAGEAGADYISFETDLDLVKWWTEIMVVPQVVELAADLSRAGDFIAAGADFLCLDEGIWRSEEGLKSAIASVMALIR